uniref:Uncharacterized protein n=1 Tax=Oryza brachyantha TaxID=4533 RepID=J3M9L4_ORYBR
MVIRSGEQSATKAEKQQHRPASDSKAHRAEVVMALAKADSKFQHHAGGSGHSQAAADHHGPSSSSKAAAAATPVTQKFELPRIYTTLSRKEKEEDFMAMKGTKLPQRPKKRPKLVEKQVNFICPGMWLSDVTRSKYIVREKKCTKKLCRANLRWPDEKSLSFLFGSSTPQQQKYRGLKGMESMDSDSD